MKRHIRIFHGFPNIQCIEIQERYVGFNAITNYGAVKPNNAHVSYKYLLFFGSSSSIEIWNYFPTETFYAQIRETI